MAYQYGATRQLATSADRARIHALESQLNRVTTHSRRLEQEIRRLEDQTRRLKAQRRQQKRKAAKEATPTYLSTLTPEQREYRHGDGTGKGATHLYLAAAEAARHKKDR